MGIRYKAVIRKMLEAANLELRWIPGHVKNRYAWLRNRGIRTVLDVGANTGQFSRQIRRFLPDAYIYAFEPRKDLFADLERAGREIGRFRGINVALGSYEGTARLRRNKFSPASSILEMTELAREAYPYLADGSDEEVPIYRLDDAIGEFGITLEQPVLLKIDAQGYEGPVIGGGMTAIARCCVVLVEVTFRELYRGQMLFDGIYGILRESGFEFHGCQDISCHNGNGLPLFGDAIFVRAGQ